MGSVCIQGDATQLTEHNQDTNHIRQNKGDSMNASTTLDLVINSALAGLLFTLAFGFTVAVVIWLSNQSRP